MRKKTTKQIYKIHKLSVASTQQIFNSVILAFVEKLFVGISPNNNCAYMFLQYKNIISSYIKIRYISNFYRKDKNVRFLLGLQYLLILVKVCNYFSASFLFNVGNK